MNLRFLANPSKSGSLSNTLRARRFTLFERLTESVPKPIRIIDLGGTNTFWEQRGWAERDDVRVTCVNLDGEPQRHANVTCVQGDATKLEQFDDQQFDVAFSNSVIEHLFTLDQQRAMASEAQRVAEALWVQTPNYWFPVEPHFHVPGWQWLPEGMRVAMVRRWRCGWRGPCKDIEHARAAVREIRLMTRRELRSLFPGARIVPEWFGPLVKSWIVLGGWAPETLKREVALYTRGALRPADRPNAAEAISTAQTPH